jgi:hypothetical protein
MRTWAAAVLVVLLCPAVAGAAPRDVTLPDPHVGLTPQPPLSGGGGGLVVVPRTGRTHERVAVGVDATGRPVRITVDQRIELVRPGDYSFFVPGPVLDVRAPAGSRVQPGLLDQAIVWQGFSPGRRTLAARASLDVAKAAPFLPLAVELQTLIDGRPLAPGERRSGRLETVLTIRNRTAARAQVVRGTGSPAALAAFLDGTRRRIDRGLLAGTTTVAARVVPATVTVAAPLRLTGTLELSASARDVNVQGGRRVGRKVEFGGTVGDALTVRVSARVEQASAPRLELSASPQPLAALEPPGRGTWRAALTSGRVGRARLFDDAVAAMLRLARANQYAEFLASPGIPERATTVYSYTTSNVASVVAAPAPPPEDGGLSTLVTVALAVAGLGAAVVLWAYL